MIHTKGSVRRFGPHEWQVYRRLRTQALSDSPDAFSSTLEDALSRSDADWSERLAGTSDELDLPLIAEVGDSPVGLAWGRIEPSDPGVAYLYQMWVAPEHRRHGIARMLLDAVVDWSRRRGARSLQLGVTWGNDEAVGLYASAGFVATGAEEPLRPGSDRMIQSMGLDLGDPTAE
jgi:ribosomal protein S18 acetylase RimI-like enzyme